MRAPQFHSTTLLTRHFIFHKSKLASVDYYMFKTPHIRTQWDRAKCPSPNNTINKFNICKNETGSAFLLIKENDV
jgi:hypothetical protein